MTAYTITIDKEQAQALARATEILAHLGIEQFRDAIEFLPPHEEQEKQPAMPRILALMGTERATECPHCGSVIEPANYNRPTGCVCNVGEWADPENIPPVCDGFVGENHDINCGRCEHDYECHGINKQEGLP